MPLPGSKRHYAFTVRALPRTLDSMESLFDILSRREIDEPPEIRIIKQYVRDNFRAAAGVLVRERDIIVTVPSSALAGALRARTYHIAKLLGEKPKRLVFRIGTIEAA